MGNLKKVAVAGKGQAPQARQFLHQEARTVHSRIPRQGVGPCSNEEQSKEKNGSISNPSIGAFIRHTDMSKNDMHPKTRKILYSLRLRKVYNGVFVKENKTIIEILQKVEPYVTYGYPNVKSVKDFIYKKGVVRVFAQRVPLTDNNVVEQELGKHDIICIEDIVNEIVTVGKHFKPDTNFICLFLLNNPEKALHGKKKRFEDGGDSGNYEDLNNELLGKMNYSTGELI